MVKFSNLLVRHFDAVTGTLLVWGIVSEVVMMAISIALILILGPRFPSETRKVAVILSIGFPFLWTGLLLGVEQFLKHAEREFSKMFFPYPSPSDWRMLLSIKTKLYYEDITFYQGKVDARLSELAGEFFAACQKTPPSAQRIRALKEKFWRAHNLAWSLGFAVRPKIKNYIKKEEGR